MKRRGSETQESFARPTTTSATCTLPRYWARRVAPTLILGLVVLIAGCRALRREEQGATAAATARATLSEVPVPTQTALPPANVTQTPAPQPLGTATILPVVPTATPQPVPSAGGFPAQRRVDTSNLVVYQVWLNYYAQNGPNGQTSPSVFANAQAHLPELAKMGVTMIQLSPFQPFGRETTIGSPYGILDYEDVNPGYAGFSAANPGTKEARIQALKDYVAQAHQLGIQVIMDCVYHSTDPHNVLATTHPDYYKRDAAGNAVRNQYNFAELDYTNPNLRTYMINMTKYWESTVDIDGCRADVAVDVPLSFWAMLNNELKKIKPSWFMVAETNSQIPAYASPYSGPGYNPGETYSNVYGFDAVYGVRYMGAVRGILEKRYAADLLPQAWQWPQAPQVQAPPGTILYRAVDNHDQRPRAVELGTGNSGMVAAMVVNFTLDGIPFIFDGQEIGDTAPTSIQIQRFISWNNPSAPQDRTLFGQMINLRKAHPALNQGSTTWYTTDHPSAVVSFLREAGNERILVVVNLSSDSGTVVVMGTGDHPLNGNLSALPSTESASASLGQNRVQVSLPAYGYYIGSLH